MESGEYFFHEFAIGNRRAFRSPVVRIRHAQVIEADQVHHGRMQVVNVDRPISSVVPSTWPFLTPPPAIHILKPQGL